MTLLLGAGLFVVALAMAVFAGALLLASPASLAVLAIVALLWRGGLGVRAACRAPRSTRSCH